MSFAVSGKIRIWIKPEVLGLSKEHLKLLDDPYCWLPEHQDPEPQEGEEEQKHNLFVRTFKPHPVLGLFSRENQGRRKKYDDLPAYPQEWYYLQYIAKFDPLKMAFWRHDILEQLPDEVRERKVQLVTAVLSFSVAPGVRIVTGQYKINGLSSYEHAFVHWDPKTKCYVLHIAHHSVSKISEFYVALRSGHCGAPEVSFTPGLDEPFRL